MIILWEHKFFFETLIGQLLALVAFFAFPIIQYLILKRFIIREGRPELWYLPSYGFRLVIRNIPNKRILNDIKYKSVIRNFINANPGASPRTILDEILSEREDFFLFPGYDEILLCFKVEGKNKEELKFILTDKLGNSKKEFPIKDRIKIISDYSATVKNILNFDMKISKRVEINSISLISYWESINESNSEGLFECSKIIDVG